ncbi:glycosyltransferase family 4 protein [Roseibacillus persicicus]|uniref:glycosyltransferase family 4 protein n=1 Tax=Roseibacillus persicicus TaxID=454148 RepID=UPI00398A548B
MKILIGTTRPFHLFHLANALASQGHEITVVGYMPRSRCELKIDHVVYISLFWKYFPITVLAFQRYNRFLQGWATLNLMKKVDKFLVKHLRNKTNQYDLFIGLSGCAVESFDAAMSKSIKTICERGSSHVSYQQKVMLDSSSEFLDVGYVDRELKGYSKANYISTLSAFAKNTFLEHGVPADKILLNPLGVNLERFPSRSFRPIDNQDFSIIFVGGWGYRKGCDILSEYVNRTEGSSLLHVGTVGVSSFPGGDRIKKMGHVANGDLSALYQKADILILPSREDGFGMVLLEALVSGCYVIASKNTGGPEIKEMAQHYSGIQIMDDVSVESIARCVDAFGKVTQSEYTDFVANVRPSLGWSGYGKRYWESFEKLVK